jgi:predicted Zn-dependent peptidase
MIKQGEPYGVPLVFERTKMIDLFTLPNGLRIVGERIPYIHSVSIGIWVKAGSVFESNAENGISHFIEHMAFKGTSRRSARQIAEEMDAVGGHLNAATGKHCTCYYAKVIDTDLSLACDMLADITRFPVLDEGEMQKEKDVVLEEISMADDTPEDVVFDLIADAVFHNQPSGMTILGPRENITALNRNNLVQYRMKHYGPANAVVSVAGNYDINLLRDMIKEYFGDWKGSAGESFPIEIPNVSPLSLSREKDTEQIHLCIGFPGKATGNPDVYPMAVFNNIFGGGMSSRLFQRIREDMGMVYSVYSSPSSYPTCGDFSIYAATSPKHVKSVLKQIDAEIRLLLRDGATVKEFQQAKAQLKGSFILGQESAYNHMNSLGQNLLLLGRCISEEETISGIENVKMEETARVAAETLNGIRSMAIVGRKAGKYLMESANG